MKFVKYEREFIKDILASHSTQSYPFTFIGLKVFGGFYVGFIWCRLNRRKLYREGE